MFVKFISVAGLLAVVLSVVAHSSRGGGHAQIYRVKPYDTVWSIATAHYAGDPRAAIWKIERRNRIVDAVLTPGERIVLP
jgi:LysM domain